MKPTIIVSGFARTGTSTMMRMLYAGGVGVRATEDRMQPLNRYSPSGTFELKDVGLRLAEEPPEWTAGYAVKLVAQYLDWLPQNRPLRVIFMLRDVNEIISSLVAMKVIWEDDPVSAIGRARRLLHEYDVPTLDVQYRDMIKYPRATAELVADFIERPGFDIEAAASTVDARARRKAFEDADPEIVQFKADKISRVEQSRR